MIKLATLLKEITGKPKAIFLAGPAGSGKTYTMTGTLDYPGIMVLIL